MAVGDTVTLTRTVTLGANGFIAGTLTNTLSTPARLISVTSNNANVVIAGNCVDGISQQVVQVGSVVVVTLLNLVNSSQTATVTATLILRAPHSP